MPNRIIKESVCTSDNLDALSWYEECFFYRLIVNCDDYGRMDARPAILRARLFPLKTVTNKAIEDALKSLRAAGLIDLYEVDGRSILQLRTWERHQQIRARKSKYPSPDSGSIHSHELAINCNQLQSIAISCNQLQSNAPVIQSESESESNPKGERARVARFTPPTPDEVRSYAAEKGLTGDADRFCDFYASKGWRVGSQPMRDWKAAVRGWCARDRQDAAHADARGPTVKTVREQQYTQRAYTEDDSLPAWMMERLAEGQAQKGASP